MSEILISRGKNLQEAIDLGLKSMNLTKSQVDIEIVQQEDKKYLGLFGSKPAVVRLIEKPLIKSTGPDIQMEAAPQPPLIMQNEEKSELPVDFGKVWVTDGRIFCKETSTHFPTITTADGVLLYKNGELIKKTTVLMEKDQVTVEFQNERKDLDWSISLDPTKTKATLHIEPGYRKTYRLVDQEPSSHIQLEIRLHEEIFNHPQLHHIEQRMKELGITTGIQKFEILKALKATEPGEYTIAKGTESFNGENGWIEFIVDNDNKETEPKILENGAIDYREFLTNSQVDKGQLLGTIHPSKPARTGTTVTGEEISPTPIMDTVIRVQRGVALIDQGTKIVSLLSGRPHIQYKDLVAEVSVIPKYVHSADVDHSSGNLSYLGDIEVEGNVTNGMSVEAINNIYINGVVNQATLTSGNRMIVSQDVLNSHLKSGKINPVLVEIAGSLEKLSADLKNFISAIRQVYQSPVFKTADIAQVGLSSLIRILLEKKFIDLSPLIKEFSTLILKNEKLEILGSEFKEIHSDLIDGFVKLIPSQYKNPEDIGILIERMDEALSLISASQHSRTDLVIPFSKNSKIDCSGDISIVGKGCTDSNVHSGGFVRINGVLTGGEVYAAMGIEAEETGGGSQKGVMTRLIVPEGETIRISKAMKDTIIQIGHHSHKFTHTELNVFAHVTKEKQLLLREREDAASATVR